VENKGVKKEGCFHGKIVLKIISTLKIRTNRGMQRERAQRRVLRSGIGYRKKIGLKVMGMTTIKTKRGI